MTLKEEDHDNAQAIAHAMMPRDRMMINRLGGGIMKSDRDQMTGRLLGQGQMDRGHEMIRVNRIVVIVIMNIGDQDIGRDRETSKQPLEYPSTRDPREMHREVHRQRPATRLDQ